MSVVEAMEPAVMTAWLKKNQLAVSSVYLAAIFFGLVTSPVAVSYLVLLLSCVALSVVDVHEYKLPHQLVVLLTISEVVLLTVAGDVNRATVAAIGGVVYFGLFFVVWTVANGGLGAGDVKFAFPLGIALGWVSVDALLWGVMLMFFIGALVGLCFRVLGKQQSPFGPSMAVGCWIVLIAASTGVL